MTKRNTHTRGRHTTSHGRRSAQSGWTVRSLRHIARRVGVPFVAHRQESQTDEGETEMDGKPASPTVDGVYPIYRHYRADRETGQIKRYRRGLPEDERWDPTERDGYTACVLMNEGHVVGIGVFVHESNFCYRIGREAAYGRALKDAGLLPEVRAGRKARRLVARLKQEAIDGN